MPRDVRDDVSGDLFELYRRRVGADGPLRARLWYWRQVGSFTIHFTAERVRDWYRRADLGTGFSVIDLRLALRMLVRYPGLTLVSVITLFVSFAKTLIKPYKVRFTCEACGLMRHDPDAVHCKACGLLLNIPNEE